MRRNMPLCLTITLSCAAHLVAGPFTAPGVALDDAIDYSWANKVEEFSPTATGSHLELQSNALGPADGRFSSLGDLSRQEIEAGGKPGSIVLSFATPVYDGPEWDIAVFENAGQFFTPPFVFAELAAVEVSTDGVVFAQFPTTSLNVEPGDGHAADELDAQFGRNFAGVNVTNVDNLAGIHPQGLGTTFDFSDLASAAEVAAGNVRLDEIRFLRITDVPGDGSFVDQFGTPILDAWPTLGNVGGFDLDAVAARYPTECDACLNAGDFNANGEIDIDDVHRLVRAIVGDSTNPQRFDVNSDGTVDTRDLEHWIEAKAHTYAGDANLDGEFNSQDLVSVFAAGEYADDVSRNSTYATGDWNADLEFDSADVVAAFAQGGYEQGPRAAAIPEPTVPRIWFGALITSLYLRRVHRIFVE